MKWNSISCYCDISETNSLLNQIKIFIICNKEKLLHYKIRFSKKNGPNILLSLLTTIEDSDEIIKSAFSFFSSFFSSLNKVNVKYPINSIYLPFPTAITQFDSSFIPFEKEKVHMYKYEEALSQIIIDALDEGIRNEEIIILYIYLQAILLKSCKLLCPNKIMHPFFSKKTDALFFNYLETFYKKNVDSILEIISDVMNEGIDIDGPLWLNKWYDACESFLETIIQENENRDWNEILETSYHQTVYILKEQLNIDDKLANSLNYSICRSLIG